MLVTFAPMQKGETMIEIFFRDLTENKQKEILEAFGYESEKDGNWDVFPLCEIACEEE